MKIYESIKIKVNNTIKFVIIVKRRLINKIKIKKIKIIQIVKIVWKFYKNVQFVYNCYNKKMRLICYKIIWIYYVLIVNMVDIMNI